MARSAIQEGLTEESSCLANFIMTWDLLLKTSDTHVLDTAFPTPVPTTIDEADLALVAKLCSVAGLLSFEDLAQDETLLALRSRDPFASRSNTLDGRLQLPDYQVTFKSFVLVVAEIKTPSATTVENIDMDRKKLFNIVKQAVDALFSSGYHQAVIVIQAKGTTIDVYEFCLVGEALYHPRPLGSFKAPSSHLEFGLLLGLGPLIAVRTRGTFDIRGIFVPQ
ncbi:hypothetical protein BGW39_010540 [Mortierella sp. 14UC]|nr:hypothetical protein BGW39_010540 [Mortierella sp. 14UC]